MTFFKKYFLPIICLIVFKAKSTSEIIFKENKGQWPSFVLFGAEFSQTQFYLNKNGFNYCLFNNKDLEKAHASHNSKNGNSNTIVRGHNYFVEIPGADFTRIKKHDVLPEYYNYFIGNNKSKWASNVKASKGLLFNNVFYNTDIVLYSEGNNLKYDFVLRPGSNPGKIVMDYKFTDGVHIEKNTILIKTSVGDVIEQAPIAWQIINNKKVFISCKYILKEKNRVAFIFPQGYDKNYELIIDPAVIVCSYSGSSVWANSNCATYDNLGNIYNAGTSWMTGYPNTQGAFQLNWKKGADLVLSKYNSTGSQKIFSTYIGGSEDENINSLMVKNNEITLMGYTGSKDFPVSSNAYDTILSFNHQSFTPDIFISKMDISGSVLLYSTFIGGASSENFSFANENTTTMGDFDVDSDGNVYVISITKSLNFPVTPGAISNTLKGGQDVCVFKLKYDLSILLWSTLLGGSFTETAQAIKCDGSGGVYCFGTTNSKDFPVTAGAYSTSRSGQDDFYVSHINNSGTGLIASTYLGTTNADQAKMMTIDQNNNIYVCGYILSSGILVPSSGSYFNNDGVNCIYKMNKDLNTVIYKTKIGFNQKRLQFSAFKVDSCQNIYISGFGTNSFPVTPNKIASYGGGLSDCYVAVLKNNCSSLAFASFIGINGYGHQDGSKSHFSDKGVLYQSICIDKTIPVTSNAYNPNRPHADSKYYNDAFFKMDLHTFALATTSFGSELLGCNPFSINFNASVNTGEVLWNFGDGSPLSTSLFNEHIYGKDSIYQVVLIVKDTNTCNQIDSIRTKVTVVSIPTLSIFPDAKSFCLPAAIEFSVSSPVDVANYTWMINGIKINSSESNKYTQLLNKEGSYTLTCTGNNYGCMDSVKTIFNTYPKPVADFVYSPNEPKEYDTQIYFTDASVGKNITEWKWYFNGSTKHTSSLRNPVFDYLNIGKNNCVLVVSNSYGCSDTVSKIITIADEFVVYVPNAFTPNGDGLNDTFSVKGTGIKSFDIEIYDRLGHKVFQSKDINNCWDGKNKSSLTEDSEYTWKLIVSDFNNKYYTRAGNVMVVK